MTSFERQHRLIEIIRQHPGIRIERQISLQEQDIPTPLKVIVYRIIVSVLDDLAQHTNTGLIHLGLWLDDDALILLIDDTATEMLDRTVTPLAMRPARSSGSAKVTRVEGSSRSLSTPGAPVRKISF